MTKSEVFAQLFSFSWPKPVELVEYANSRHGFGGDDGYYGVTYPSDLDEYQVQVEGEFISEGSVEIHYWDGDFKDLQVTEQEYLGALRGHLVSIRQVELSLQLLHAQPGIPADASGAAEF
jgi:hypothetical protein